MTPDKMTKPLKPTLRERNRYIVYKIRADKPFTQEEVGKTIWSHSLRFLGELGVSQSGLRIVDFNQKKQAGIIKCTHTTVEQVRASLALISEISQTPAALDVVYVSGTIKKAKEQYQ